MGTLTGIFGAVAAFITGFVGHVVAHDFCEVAPMLSKKLIEFAASYLPRSIRDRYLEEWRADLQAQPGTVAKLAWSLGCLRSSFQLRRQARIDRIRRTTFQFVLSTGEVVVANVSTLVFLLRIVKARRVTNKYHIPAILTATFIWLVSKPMVEWRWHSRADVRIAAHVIQAGFPMKVAQQFDGVAIEEPTEYQ
jgi:hypothetical protein